MIFTNQRSYISAMVKNTHPTPGLEGPRATPFSIISYRGRSSAPPSPPTVAPKPVPQEQPPGPKKMSWGEPTWILFHVLAEKIKDEEFERIRTELLEVIYIICSNLPCPDCANHASMYLHEIRYKTIQTKEQLKTMLFNFHNTVNKKKDFAIFPREGLEKYANYHLIPVLHAFMVKFQDKHRSIRMIADDFHRSKIAEKLKVWFNGNISKFVL